VPFAVTHSEAGLVPPFVSSLLPLPLPSGWLGISWIIWLEVRSRMYVVFRMTSASRSLLISMGNGNSHWSKIFGVVLLVLPLETV
jgi:hypothetical protein